MGMVPSVGALVFLRFLVGVFSGWALTAKCVGWTLAATLSGLIATFVGLRWIYAGGCFTFFLLVPLIAFAAGTLMAGRRSQIASEKRSENVPVSGEGQ